TLATLISTTSFLGISFNTCGAYGFCDTEYTSPSWLINLPNTDEPSFKTSTSDSYLSELTLFGSIIASSMSWTENRVPNCVRSGPIAPPSPCIIWHDAQRTAANSDCPCSKFLSPLSASTAFAASSIFQFRPGPFGGTMFSNSALPDS